jgi:hypothetical protein
VYLGGVNPFLEKRYYFCWLRFWAAFDSAVPFDNSATAVNTVMKKIHDEKRSEKPSTRQSNAEQIGEQLDLFEWGGLTDESCVGFAVRSGR